ncbi:hypothetical protein BHK98_07040 [Hornefia porci]|uniref:Uncharacterized protein n=1 Tax=Hornefia porci TaxID=2652292 RepID=A0A1Q9JI49_9FIRM|nr:hypothetical protein BHK98_07040 [Hornefia porci]
MNGTQQVEAEEFKNTTLLSQKQKLLKESIGQTKEKLEGLKEAQKQAKEPLERGELRQDKYDALQREIAETENELKRRLSLPDSE